MPVNDTLGPDTVIAYIGIGSNLDGPVQQVEDAIEELGHLPLSRCELVSSLYANPPMGSQDQPDYVNAVVELHTRLQPHDLLAELQSIENRHDRKRGDVQWGPRTLDLDILLYGKQELNTADLRIPHPGAHERAFVLYPLLELRDGLSIPGKGEIKELVKQVPKGRMQRVDSHT